MWSADPVLREMQKKIAQKCQTRGAYLQKMKHIFIEEIFLVSLIYLFTLTVIIIFFPYRLEM
jgi:hypothetical protein